MGTVLRNHLEANSAPFKAVLLGFTFRYPYNTLIGIVITAVIIIRMWIGSYRFSNAHCLPAFILNVL